MEDVKGHDNPDRLRLTSWEVCCGNRFEIKKDLMISTPCTGADV